MGAYGVSIASDITFRGTPQRTNRVYHYRITAPIASDYDILLDAVLAQDRLAHGPNHSYKLGRVWGPTQGADSDNLMRVVRDLTGTGSASYAGANIYPELAYFVTMYIGRSPTSNRKVFLKKFIHPAMWKTAGGSSDGQSAVAAADKTFFKGWFEGCKHVSSGGIGFDLVSPRDQLCPSDAVANVGNFLHVRQLHQ
jgi:hypothetical protein